VENNGVAAYIMGRFLNTHLLVSQQNARQRSFINRKDFLKLTFAINASCLTKERCITETDNYEKYIYILGARRF
jgi:hypothetical protein